MQRYQWRGDDRSELTGGTMLPVAPYAHGVQNVTLASAASTAALTVGLAAYSALLLAGIAVAIYDARRHRRGRAIAAAEMVGVLTLGGLVIAIVSSAG